MYAKILIKAAILLLVINVALIGVISNRGAWLGVAIFNLIAIFILLFQERSAFTTTPSPNKRILFTTDVFGWIAVGIGIVIAGFSQLHGTTFPPLLRGVLGGGLFYLLTVAIFDLSTEGYRKDSGVRVIATIVILLVLWLLAQRFGIISANSISNSYQRVVGRRQGTLQSIVVDKDLVLPKGQGGVVVNKPTDTNKNPTGDSKDTLSGTNNNDDSNNSQKDGRIFDTTVRTQQGNLTYGTFLPVLFDALDIPASTNNYTFASVDRSSSYYPSFALARDYNMIGSNTNPASSISCQTLMVLLGLAQERNLSYTSSTVLDVFRAEAVEKGYTAYGCTDREAIATWANLP